jgi:hypothetical protein
MGKTFVRTVGATVAIIACACSTPDGDDIDDLAAGIRGLPPQDQGVVFRSKENDRLARVVRDLRTPSGKVGSVTCAERDDPAYKDQARRDPIVTREWMLRKLAENPLWGLEELFAAILDSFNPGPFDGPNCTPKFDPMPGWSKQSLQGEVDALAKDDDETTDSAFWLPTLDTSDLKNRPVLMGVLGLAFASGVIVVSVTNPVVLALCPKSDAVPCPGNPLGPGGEPATEPGDEGDR